MDIKKVAVIGAGIMGHGISQVIATAGLEVKLYDISEEMLEKAKYKIENSLERGIKKGKIDEKAKKDILERISFTPNLSEAVKNADLIIEAVYENLDLKKNIFKKLDAICLNETVFASNTSQYSITDIASVVSNPSRVIGMHWFNPPVAMKLIEIVRGIETSEKTVSRIKEFSLKVGKESVVCKDSQGFISTRILVAMRLECYRILEEGIATKEDIDKTLRLAFGHPMGQFELSDLSGLDIEVPICESLVKVFGDRFRPPQNLLQRVSAGKFGRKTGEGWYDYDEK